VKDITVSTAKHKNAKKARKKELQMYLKTVGFFSLLCLSVLLIGCAALFSVQEWSDNYSLMDGVQSTTPQAIDGNLNTIGEAVFPGSTVGMSPASEVVITLPEKKKIRRIVVYSDNIVEFDVFVSKDSISTDRNWTLIKEIKNARKNPTTVSVLAPFPTDRVRLRVIKTSDDAAKSREFTSKNIGFIRASNRRALGRFQEIELYGYKTSEQVEVDQQTDQREQELDDLLNSE